MGRKSLWNLPMQSHEPGYAHALAACKHFGKNWEELTKQEREWRKPAGKKAAPQKKAKPIPQENRDDLYFLADALKMAADEMRALNATLRELVADANKEFQK
jgi:hypothetical protein